MDIQCTGSTLKTNLTDVNFSPRDDSLPFHAASFLSNFSIKKFQFEAFTALADNGNPRQVVGSDERVQPNIAAKHFATRQR